MTCLIATVAAYREGSIYSGITDSQLFLISLTILLSGILTMGLLRREKNGIGNIGFKGFLVLVLYLLGGVFVFAVG